MAAATPAQESTWAARTLRAVAGFAIERLTGLDPVLGVVLAEVLLTTVRAFVAQLAGRIL